MIEGIKTALIATLQNPLVIGMLISLVMLGIGFIVNKTSNKKDDEIYAMAVNAFNIAEKVIPDKTGPAWLQKLDSALKTFAEEYAKRNGQTPTDAVKNQAKDVFAILANAVKKN